MNKRSASLAVLFIFLALGSARAQEDFTRSGPYLGVGASYNVQLLEAFFDGTPVLQNISVNDSWGVNARAGYRMLSWLALEGEYEWVNRMHARLGGVEIASLGLQSATANLRFIGPFGRFQPYLLLGAGVVWNSVDSPGSQLHVDANAFAGRVGLGLDIYLTQNLLLNFGAEGMLSPAEVRLTTPSVNVSENGLGTVTLQAGLGFRF